MKAVNRAGWFNYMDQLHHLEVPATGNSAPLARVRTAGAWLERSTAPRLETSPSLDPPAVPPSPSARDGRVFILVKVGEHQGPWSRTRVASKVRFIHVHTSSA